jgi:hypothetical protein
MLLHCQFKGFSFPPPPCSDSSDKSLLANLSLKESSENCDLFVTALKQAVYASKLEKNDHFKSYLDQLINSDFVLKNAVIEEMESFPGEYSKYFPSTNREVPSFNIIFEHYFNRTHYNIFYLSNSWDPFSLSTIVGFRGV